MLKFKTAILFVMVATCATPAFAAAGFEAGKWQHQTKLVSAQVPGVPESLIKLVAGHGSRASCNSEADLKAHPEALMTGDPKAVCKLRKLSIANGKLLFDTFCTNDRFPDGLRVVSRGAYTPDSYRISTTSTGTRDGKAVKILTTGSGKRVAATCDKP